jgi:hypothetical protein
MIRLSPVIFAIWLPKPGSEGKDSSKDTMLFSFNHLRESSQSREAAAAAFQGISREHGWEL